MKKLCFIFLLLCGATANAQTFTPLANDTFVQANGPLSANWSLALGLTPTSQVNANWVQDTTINTTGSYYYNAVTWPNDQYSQITAQTNVGTNPLLMAAVRMSTSTNTLYYGGATSAFGASTTFQIKKRINGAITNLAVTTTASAQGDRYKLAIQGSNLSLYLNDVIILTATDASITSGQAGFVLQTNANVTDEQFNNWLGGSVTAGGGGGGGTANIYITPNGTGVNSCPTGANTHDPTWFSNPANWGAGAGQIGPGSTILVCGTFNFAAGAQPFNWQGSGTSGHPITFLLDTNAVLQAPYFANTAGFFAGGRSFLIFDGGTNGLIQNTLNGSSGATCPGGPCSFQQDTEFLWIIGGHDNEVRNFHILNMFVHPVNGSAATSQGANSLKCVEFSGSNVLIHDNVFKDAGWCLQQNYTNDDNVQIYNNDISRMDHGLACAGANFVLQNLYVYNNHMHDFGNWDIVINGVDQSPHHDGIHCYNGSGGKTQNLYIYNNLFDGDQGQHMTGWIFAEGTVAQPGNTPWGDSTSHAYVWNNSFVGTELDSNGTVGINGGIIQYFNNYFQGGGQGQGSIILMDRSLGGATGTIDMENNIFQGGGQAFSFDGGVQSITAKNNMYSNIGGSGNSLFDWTGHVGVNTLASWQAGCACDAGSQSNLGAPWPNLVNGVPGAGFAGNAQGFNLATLATGKLATLINDTTAGNTRTSTARRANGAGNWDVGAYNFTGAGTPLISISPSPNNFGSVVQNVSSSPQVFTITDTGTANLILGANCCSTSGTNGADFVISSKTCSNNQIIVPAGTCTVTITFTPTTIGAEVGVLHMASNAASGNDDNLSGTGTAPGTAIASVTPNPVNFGSQTTGLTSPPQTVTVTDTGNASITLGNPNYFTVVVPFAVNGGTCVAGQVLSPAASCTLTVTFTPSATGVQSSTLTVLGNVNGSTTLNGTGTAPPQPSLTITPAAFSFGNQLKGSPSAAQQFSITNVGGAAANFPTLFFSFTGGSSPADFTRGAVGGSDCVSTLPAGTTCFISVIFTPAAIGLESTGLNILSNAATVSSSLTGTGVFPVITITPNPIAFGSFNQGTPSAGKIVSVKNTGTAAFAFTGTPITVTGTTAAYFVSSANTCSGSLAINATCTVTITFTPGSAGNFTDTFNVNGNYVATAPLTGTGIAVGPLITLAPRPVVFPSVVVGNTTSQVTVTVSNPGNANLVLANPAYTVTTGDSLDFVNVGGTCSASGTVAAAGSCTLIFTFKPTAAPRLEQTLLTVNGTVSSSVTMQGLGLSTNPAPVPWSIVSIAFNNNYQTVSVTGTGFTSANVITVQGLPVPTSCTATACIASVASSPVWLPFSGKWLTIGIK